MMGIRIQSLSSALVYCFLLAGVARADFQWIGLWQIDSQQGSASLSQPLDLNAAVPPTVSVHAFASDANHFDSSSVAFHRDFRILNVPTGQIGQLSPVLVLQTSYDDLFGYNGQAFATMSISGSQTSISQNLSPPHSGPLPPASSPIQIFGLPNGAYTLSGSLFADASQILGSGGGSMTVGSSWSFLTPLTSQTVLPAELPAPEPSSAALFGLGLLGLGAVGIRRRCRRPAALPVG